MRHIYNSNLFIVIVFIFLSLSIPDENVLVCHQPCADEPNDDDTATRRRRRHHCRNTRQTRLIISRDD